MDNIEEGVLYIYTDGSSYSRPRKGGVGFRFVFINSAGDEEQISSSHQGYTGATNNEMELQACILALEDCLSKHPSVDVMQFRGVEIYTDSISRNITRRPFLCGHVMVGDCRRVLQFKTPNFGRSCQS